MDWLVMMIRLCDLRDELCLMDDDDANCGHPVLDAIDRTRPGMSKDDCIVVDNVIGYYRESLELRRMAVQP